MRPRIATLLLAGPATALAVYMCVHYGRLSDYGVQGGVGTIIDAARAGQWHEFFSTPINMGPLALLARVPIALVLPDDASALAIYKAGTIVCALAAVAYGLWLANVALRRGQPWYVFGLVALLCAFNPISVKAVAFGHPEEMLGAALCGATMLAILSRLWLPAAILFGLALATKQWAIVAVAPVALAVVQYRLPRLRFVAVALGLAAIASLPFLASNPGGVVGMQETVSKMPAGNWISASPYSVWYEFLPVETIKIQPVDGVSEIPVTQTNETVSQFSRVLTVLLPFCLLVPLLRRRDRLRPTDPLLFLALVFWVRCVFDPFNNPYYHLPLLFILLAWEVLTLRGLPLLSVFLAGVWLLYPMIDSGQWASYPLHTELYLIWALPLGAWMTGRLFFPGKLDVLRLRFERAGYSPRPPLGSGGRAEAGTGSNASGLVEPYASP